MLIRGLAGLLLSLLLCAGASADELRAVLRTMDAEAWAKLLDHDWRRGGSCEADGKVVDLIRLEAPVKLRALCPLELAPAEDLRAKDMLRVMVFTLQRFNLGPGDLYLVNQELASARLSAYATVYWAGDDGWHGIVAMGPADGEVRAPEAPPGTARLAVTGQVRGDRYASVMGRKPSAVVEAVIGIDATSLRPLSRKLTPAEASE